MDSAQRYREFMTVPQIPGSEDFRTIQDFFSNRQFGDIRAGFPEQGIMGINVDPQLTEAELLKRFLETEGGDVETDPFVQQNIFQKGLDFLRDTPSARVGLGAILGGPVGAALSFFAPRIGRGITSLIDRFRPAPSIPRVNLNDLTTGGSDFTGATTGTGQDVSAGDLSPIGDTGFSEYSDPGTAAEYEGSF